MRFLLAPASLLYRTGMDVRNRLYDSGILPQMNVRRPVISVGNLSAGGTGKTPVVQWLSRLLNDEGAKVGIVLRGYGGSEKGPALVPPQINDLLAFSERFGDEATLYRQRLPDVAIGVGGDRIANSKNLLDGYDLDVLLADDAFQHRRLGRDLEIVLVDATVDINRQHILPWGYLREPMSNIRRADLVFLTKCNLAAPETLESNLKWLKENCAVPVFQLNFKLSKMKEVEGQKIVLLSALGNPEAFETSVRLELGVEIAHHFKFSDHHRFSKDEIKSVLEFCYKNKIKKVLMSEKDMVKFKEPVASDVQFWATHLDVELSESDQTDFLKQTLKKAYRLS